MPMEKSETSELVCTVSSFLNCQMKSSWDVLADLTFSLECSV